MKLNRLIALLLSLLLLIGACAGFAETAETEDEDPVLAEFEDVQIRLSQVYPQFEYNYQLLQNYGLDASAYLDRLKTQSLAAQLQLAIEKYKLTELGYDALTEEELASVEKDAAANWSSMMASVVESYSLNGSENPAADATEYLAKLGYTAESVYDSIRQKYATDNMVSALTEKVAVTDEALADYYQQCIAEDQSNFNLSPTTYENARLDPEAVITWNPEGYRRVYKVLLPYDDETKAAYAELKSELDAIEKAAEGETPARTAEEVQADIDALLAPAREQAEAVIAELKSAEDVAAVVKQYTADETQLQEPYITNGFYVASYSYAHVDAFKQAAEQLTAAGEVSTPVPGAEGLYIAYELEAVPFGPVAFEEVSEALKPYCLTQMQKETYFNVLSSWKTELGVKLYPENFVTPYDPEN